MSEITLTSHRTDQRHHPAIVVLHWLTVVAIIMVVAIILTREGIEGRTIRQLLLDWHRSLGLLVLVVMMARLVLRYLLRANELDHELPLLLTVLSKAGHIVLYILLITIPLLGWAQSSARGQNVNLFGLTAIPPLPFIERNRELAENLATWHETVAWLMLAIVLIHAAAALWHHFIRRDGVLRSMLSLTRC